MVSGAGGGSGTSVVRFRDEADKYSVRYWYDQKGRLVLSQNSRQANDNPQRYSYTVYDKYSRITEMGEIYQTNPNYTASLLLNQNGHVIDFLYSPWRQAGTRQQVVRTYYDEQLFTAIPLTQEHLRNRIASVTYEEVYDDDDQTYDFASHYSYDVHGNVKTLIQDITELEPLNQRYKQVDYEYELISGNVKQVAYQGSVSK